MVCERKTKGNYNIFWSGKMELPFIETGETVMEIDCGWSANEFSFGHVEFEMPITYPNEDVK